MSVQDSAPLPMPISEADAANLDDRADFAVSLFKLQLTDHATRLLRAHFARGGRTASFWLERTDEIRFVFVFEIAAPCDAPN